MAVTQLEEKLGVTFFIRPAQQINVTGEGQRFLTRLKESLLMLDMGHQALRDMLRCTSVKPTWAYHRCSASG
jgi:DNA-binding transcriptional LysR family regulator